MTIFDTLINRKHTHSVKWSGLPSDDTIPMCVADMDFPVAPPIASAIRERAAHEIFGYTRYTDTLHETIVAWIARRYHWAIDPAAISMNQGVVTSLCTAIRALTREGERIIIQTPVYHPFYSIIRANHRMLVENPLTLEQDVYRMDFDLLERQAQEAKLLILCSPHNPVGRVWTPEELTRLGRICLEHGVTVISDDIHADFAWARPYVPFAALDDDFAQNSVTCFSASKTFNIAGLNTSYEVIPNPALRKKVRLEKAGSGIHNPNLFGLLALEHAYRAGDAWLDDLLCYLDASRTLLREHIRTWHGVELIEPEGTYLAWLDCRKLGCSSDALTAYLLEKARVRLLPGTVFGAAGEGFLRMNFGTSHATLTEALARTADALFTLPGSDMSGHGEAAGG